MARVEFYAGSTLLGSDTSSPYSFTWSSAPAGSYTLTAVAFDADGGQATSSAVSITVQPAPNQAPSVTLTSPANGATFTAPATITLTATASDPENQLARVEFYQGSTLLGTDTSSPYSFTWSSAPAGSYTLTAVASDADGATDDLVGRVDHRRGRRTSRRPSTLTSPANGATFTAPATITLTATASDPENQLARVEFYRGSTLLGTDTSSPYSFTWSSAPAGSYTLTAVASDADGGTDDLVGVSITVSRAEPAAVRDADLTRQRRDVHGAGDHHAHGLGLGSRKPARARRVLPGQHAARHRHVVAVLVHVVVGAGGVLHADGEWPSMRTAGRRRRRPSRLR